jgi:RNA polymerase sigma-70 factor (family 1)
MTDSLNDTHLLALLNAGDDTAFRVIYKQYVKSLLSYCRRNIERPEDCEEIVQEVFESLWARRQSLKIVSLRHYLFSAARYKIIRYFQHRKVKQKYEAHYKFFQEVYDAIEKDEKEDIELIQQKLDRCLNDLPERCQVVFRLRLYENLSNSEIAERMKITKKTVEVYIFKAFSHLRNSYHKIYRTI